MIWSQFVALSAGIPDGLVSLTVGLWGVALARWVFVNRENRRLPRKQPWHETLPLTLVASLVAAVVIIDRDLGLSAAAFTGLGVGWAAVLLLDVLGDRITAAFKAGMAVPEHKRYVDRMDMSGEGGQVTAHEIDTPEDMARSIDALDAVPGTYDDPTPREPTK